MANMSLELIMATIGVLGALFKTIKFVQEGEMGIKLRFGRALRNKDGTPRIIPPGFILLIPFVETLQRHHVRQQTLRLNNQQVMINRGLIFNVSAVVILRVKDIYRALFEIDDLDNSLIDLSMGILRDVLSGKNYTELSDMENISYELLHKLQEKAEEWGVTFIQFKLTDCAPTQQTAPLVNAKASVEMKMEALKSASDKLKVDISTIPASFAAALVGVPLVTAITNEMCVDQSQTEGKSKNSFLKNLLLGNNARLEMSLEGDVQ